MTDDVMRFFAAWMLTHETADEGLKAAVERGEKGGAEGMSGGPDAFVDGLAAMVAEEKERLKAELEARARGEVPPVEEKRDPVLDEIRFEVGELRGRLDNLESMLESILARLEARS
ncbi:MAG: hypothetical protein Kow0067_16650 [Coriobacteriia bacterium]